jgi:GR25 family glycosyltransferase involved in LPS biosynthesis
MTATDTAIADRHGLTLPPATNLPRQGQFDDVSAAARYTGTYINLDRSADRRAQIDAELATFGLQHLYRRFPAADGNVLTYPNPRLSEGEIGCFTSHLLLLKQNLAAEAHVHVVEDDAMFSRFTAQMIKFVVASGAIDQYDVVFTDSTVTPTRSDYEQYRALYDERVERDAAGNVTRVYPRIVDCYVGAATSYIVNRRSIPKLVGLFTRELTNGATMPIDLFIRKAARDGILRVGSLFPFATSLRIENVLNNTIAGRGYNLLSRIAVCLGRISFFVECDHRALCECTTQLFSDRAARPPALPLQGSDAHRQILKDILGFCASDKFVQY